jgi:hypothetical protein
MKLTPRLCNHFFSKKTVNFNGVKFKLNQFNCKNQYLHIYKPARSPIKNNLLSKKKDKVIIIKEAFFLTKAQR